MSGYIGKILKVDLTKRKVKKQRLKESFCRKWLGGYGLGCRIVYSDITPKIDPLGPENILGLTTGVLTGTSAPFSGSFTAVGKSPLTGTWGDSRGGGFFGPELKKAGFDAVFFYGRSPKPVYLWIKDGIVQIRSASDIWGKDTAETEDIVKEKHEDEKVQVASIGLSGEKMSKISCIVTDKGRAAGRSGLGAVMGSKNLKAVVVRGTRKILVEDHEKLLALRKKVLNKLKEDKMAQNLKKYGMNRMTAENAFSGDSPVKNWGGVGKEDFPNAKEISDENVVKYEVRKYACFNCPVGCGGLVKVKKGRYKVEGHKPEYETLASFGTLCLNDDVESIIYINDICNKYGLDTISAGASVAFAIECYDNGLINKEDTDGIELTWGNTNAIVAMTEKMAKLEGFGNVLADGVKEASEKIGKGSEKYAMHVCGQELPMHDPRLLTRSYNARLGVIYTVDATPARHTQGIGVEHAVEALGICKVFMWTRGGSPRSTAILPNFVNAVTGWNISYEELTETGNRIATIRQAFNVREGFKPSDFVLPNRILGKPPLKSGPLVDVTIHPEIQVKQYFESMGWNPKTGRPSKKTLTELGLKDIIKDVY